MAKKNKTGWWLVLLGGGAALWYFMQKKPATATTTPAPAALPLGSGGAAQLPAVRMPQLTLAPVTAVIPPTTTTAITAPAPAALSTTTVTNPPGSIPQTPQAQTVVSYFQGMLTGCDLARWNASVANFTPDEWNGLIDLYFNDWVGGQGTTPARTTFWNSWRSKYSILTNTPC